MVRFNCALTRDCDYSSTLSGNSQGAPGDCMLGNIVEHTSRVVDYGTMGHFSEGPMLYANEDDQRCAKKDGKTGYVLELPMVYEKRHNRTQTKNNDGVVSSEKAVYALKEAQLFTRKHNRTPATETSERTTSSPGRKNNDDLIEISALKSRRTPASEEHCDTAVREDAVGQHLLPFQSWTLNLRRHEYNLRHPLFKTPAPTEPELFCSFCGVPHPSALFSEEEREKPHGERTCHGVTGSIRVCTHLSVPMVDIWKWFDTGVALQQEGNGDQIEPLVGACETCRGRFNLDEFGAAMGFVKPPGVTVHPHNTEWFDVFSLVEVTWKLPVFKRSQRGLADKTTTGGLLVWKLEELDWRQGGILCIHVDRWDIARVFASKDGGGRATKCHTCSAVYSWERHDGVEFLRMVCLGRLVKKDGGKRCFEGYRGLVQSVSSLSYSGLP